MGILSGFAIGATEKEQRQIDGCYDIDKNLNVLCQND